MCSIAVVSVLSFWVIHRYRPFDEVNPLIYNRIELGMTAEEAEEVVGVAPGDYGRPRTGGVFSSGQHGRVMEEAGLPFPVGRERPGMTWWGKHFAIEVALDERGVVTSKRLLKIE